MRIACPLIHRADSETNNATLSPISATVPTRFIGDMLAIAANSSGDATASFIISVFVGPIHHTIRMEWWKQQVSVLNYVSLEMTLTYQDE
jgi:hypothetical protein